MQWHTLSVLRFLFRPGLGILALEHAECVEQTPGVDPVVDLHRPRSPNPHFRHLHDCNYSAIVICRQAPILQIV